MAKREDRGGMRCVMRDDGRGFTLGPVKSATEWGWVEEEDWAGIDGATDCRMVTREELRKVTKSDDPDIRVGKWVCVNRFAMIEMVSGVPILNVDASEVVGLSIPDAAFETEEEARGWAVLRGWRWRA